MPASGQTAHGRWLCEDFTRLNDYRTPVRVAVWVVSLNLVLNLTLIWPLAEAGLAISTTVATVVQLFILMAIFSRRQAPLGWPALAATSVRAVLATAAMAGAVCLILPHMPTSSALVAQLVHVGVPILLGAAAYCGAYLLLGGRELGMLWSGKVED